MVSLIEQSVHRPCSSHGLTRRWDGLPPTPKDLNVYRYAPVAGSLFIICHPVHCRQRIPSYWHSHGYKAPHGTLLDQRVQLTCAPSVLVPFRLLPGPFSSPYTTGAKAITTLLWGAKTPYPVSSNTLSDSANSQQPHSILIGIVAPMRPRSFPARKREPPVPSAPSTAERPGRGR